MQLNTTDRVYLEKRQKALKWWKFMGPVLLLAITGFVVYLYVKTPLLINPWETASRLESQTIQQPSLELMAMMLPIAFMIVCFLLITLILMIYTAFSHEKKYFRILKTLEIFSEKP